MGGYAAFVWPAYAVSFLVLAGAAWLSLSARARLRKSVAALEADTENASRE
jgi:heme exporter protein CcmD